MDQRAKKRVLKNIFIPILAILSGLILSSIFILIAGKNPLTAYSKLMRAAFSCHSFQRCNLFTTFQLATPLMLTGLSAVVAFKSGLFSLGQEGQLMLGGMMAAWLGYILDLPAIVHPLVAILAGMLVGGAYAWIPAVLKVKLEVNEIISTIVLNTIAHLFVTYLINFPLRAEKSTTAYSPIIDETAKLQPFAPGSKWGIGFVIALLAMGVVAFRLRQTTSGYEERMAGQSPAFAIFGGVPSTFAAIRGMFISGMLSGLAGAVQALGVHYRMLDGFSGGLGFDGLTAAILGQVHPIGTTVVAFFFAGLRYGAQVGLQLGLGIPRELGGIIIAMMILFVAADQLFDENLDRLITFWNRFRNNVIAKEKLPWK